jgi:AraC-like DNA-binding protein
MSIELTISQNGALEFKSGLPSHYNGPILKGAIAYFTKTNLADLVLQELEGENYSIRFVIGKFLKRVHLSGLINTEGLYSYFMLKSGIRKQINSIGKLHIRQEQFACLYSAPSGCKAMFEKNKEFKTIDIYYSPKLLEELLPFFPELKVTLNTTGGLITAKPFWMPAIMKEITAQILSCPYNETTRQFYFDLKVRELLYQILESAYNRKVTDVHFTPWEISKIHEARSVLQEYISQKPPSIKWLSKRVALNEFKLKLGFRQYFDSSIIDWLQEEKMKAAKELVLTTNKPIKEICEMVGYPLTTNFITAFRRRFGVTPGSIRRK